MNGMGTNSYYPHGRFDSGGIAVIRPPEPAAPIVIDPSEPLPDKFEKHFNRVSDTVLVLIKQWYVEFSKQAKSNMLSQQAIVSEIEFYLTHVGATNVFLSSPTTVTKEGQSKRISG
jgi:hypothetical protein